MKTNLERYVDNGCWISDDRVNAFFSATAKGITEIGYHGTQPVSRNSRIFALDEGALVMWLRTVEGTRQRLYSEDVEWHPAGIRFVCMLEDRTVSVTIAALARAIVIAVSDQLPAGTTLELRFNVASLFSQVQGSREWEPPAIREREVLFTCRDRILLDEWIQRTGAYAGDFLIPEPWRKTVFHRRCRSGLAGPDDLVDAFKGIPIPLYDALTTVAMGGNGFSITEEGEEIVFSASGQSEFRFTIQFSSPPELPGSDQDAAGASPLDVQEDEQQRNSAPALSLPGHPELERVFSMTPGIVNSSIVNDIGMPRATPGAYYWIWAWDTLVTALEMLRWGDFAGVRRILTFISSHRDDDGVIPGRWTRSLQPLDTPEAGALEALFAILVLQYTVESDDRQPLIDAYPYLLRHLERTANASNGEGLFRNIGFYPDLPTRYGRTEQSAVACEVGAFYVFCRALNDCASLLGDVKGGEQADRIATRVELHFLANFWDTENGFLIDSVDLLSGLVNRSFPLFSLLFLQSATGVSLIRDRLEEASSFMTQHHLDDRGTSLVPPWDIRHGTEDALAAWYPHWDLYMVKIFRRAGNVDGLLRWLDNVEQLLNHLGYVPEFLALPSGEWAEPDDWRKHGAYANLNCMTGVYRAVLEGVAGLEVDSAGVSVIPLALPLGDIHLSRVQLFGCRWEISVKNHGAHFEGIRVDGEPLVGCTRIPARFIDGREHHCEISYGLQPSPNGFREIVGAEVLDIQTRSKEIRLVVQSRAKGTATFFSAEKPRVLVDGRREEFRWNEETGMGTVAFRGGHHRILALGWD